MTHAGWNAAARSRDDPSGAITAAVVMAGVVAIPFVIWLGLPPVSALPWLCLGTVVNLISLRLLMTTYRTMPFAMGYPIFRGSIPLAIVAMNFVFLPEQVPHSFGLIGIILISTGVMLLARSGRKLENIGMKPLLLAISGGFFAGAYVLTDVMGIHASGNAIVYGLAAAMINSISMPIVLKLEGMPVGAMLRKNLAFGTLAGIVSMISYGFFLYSLTYGPVGPVSAIRETSVLFALLIAVVTLKERVGPMRWLACALGFAGAALLRLY
jgi:drug/metabolite transporter (DMT)-like permease